MDWSEKDEDKYQKAIKKYTFRREDFDGFRAKKYYTAPINEMKLQVELDQINKQLNIFKFHKDLPKASVRSFGMYERLELMEVHIFMGAIFSFICGRIYSNERFGIYNSNDRIRKSRFKFFLGFLVFEMFYLPTTVPFMPQNRYFRIENNLSKSGLLKPLRFERKLQNKFDRELDLYRNVQTFIKKDPEPTFDEFKTISNRALQRSLNSFQLKIHQ